MARPRSPSDGRPTTRPTPSARLSIPRMMARPRLGRHHGPTGNADLAATPKKEPDPCLQKILPRPCNLRARVRGIEARKPITAPRGTSWQAVDRAQASGPVVGSAQFHQSRLRTRRGARTAPSMSSCAHQRGRLSDGRNFKEIALPEKLVFTSGALDEKGKLLFEFLHTVTFVERDRKTALTIRSQRHQNNPGRRQIYQRL